MFYEWKWPDKYARDVVNVSPDACVSLTGVAHYPDRFRAREHAAVSARLCRLLQTTGELLAARGIELAASGWISNQDEREEVVNGTAVLMVMAALIMPVPESAQFGLHTALRALGVRLDTDDEPWLIMVEAWPGG